MRNNKRFSSTVCACLLMLFCSIGLLNVVAFGSDTGNAVKYRNSYYKIFTGSYTWTQAKSECQKMGGHLVTITSENEQRFIQSLNSSDRSLWIGGYRDDQDKWCWVTGEKWNYQNWGDGEPNNSSNVIGNERYAAVWPQKWNDLADTNTYEQSGFICEWKAPMIPDITKVKKKTGLIKGKTSANCTVYIKIGNATYTGKSNSKGLFSIKTKRIKSHTAIKIRAKSAKGFYSKWDKVKVS